MKKAASKAPSSEVLGITLLFLVILGFLWRPGLPSQGTVEQNSSETGNLITVIDSAVKPGDQVFIAPSVREVVQAVNDRGALSIEFSNYDDFWGQFSQWLEVQCGDPALKKDAFVIWGDSEKEEFIRLSRVFRTIFFFSEYTGLNQDLTDKIYSIQVRPEKLERYCEVQRIKQSQEIDAVVIVIDTDIFSPLSGSVIAGEDVWLPNGSLIDINYEKSAIRNWDLRFNLIPRVESGWTYYNKERSAYRQVLTEKKELPVLIDKNIEPGDIAGLYYSRCSAYATGQVIESELFDMLCRTN